jgi:hypothetical protein
MDLIISMKMKKLIYYRLKYLKTLCIFLGFLWLGVFTANQGIKLFNFYYQLDIIIILIINVFINGLIFSYLLSSDGISLRVIYSYYSFIFLSFVPIFQYLTGIWRFGFEFSLIKPFILLINFGNLVYFLTYFLIAKIEKTKIKKVKNLNFNYIISERNLFLLSIPISIIALTLISIYGFNPSTSIVRTAMGTTHSPFESILEFIFRPLVFFLFLFSFINLKFVSQQKASIFLFLVYLLNVILIINPLSSARSITLFLYFPILIIIFPPSHKRSFFYLFFLLFSIAGSFFQTEVRNLFLTGQLKGFSVEYMFEGHFDGFEMGCHTLAFVQESGIEYGKQLAGALLFFIPRKIWPSKPVGSGEYIGWEYLSKHFEVLWANFGMPLVAEAYLNFHYIGVLIFFIFIGRISFKLDHKFKLWQNSFYQNQEALKFSFNQNMILYPMSLGFFLFALRGDLFSAFSFATGLVISFLIAKKLIIIKCSL